MKFKQFGIIENENKSCIIIHDKSDSVYYDQKGFMWFYCLSQALEYLQKSRSSVAIVILNHLAKQQEEFLKQPVMYSKKEINELSNFFYDLTDFLIQIPRKSYFHETVKLESESESGLIQYSISGNIDYVELTLYLKKTDARVWTRLHVSHGYFHLNATKEIIELLLKLFDCNEKIEDFHANHCLIDFFKLLPQNQKDGE